MSGRASATVARNRFWSKRRSAARSARAGAAAPEEEAKPVAAPAPAEKAKPKAEDAQAGRVRVVLPQLSEEEKDARMRALTEARQREATERERRRKPRPFRSSTKSSGRKSAKRPTSASVKRTNGTRPRPRRGRSAKRPRASTLSRKRRMSPRARPMRVTRRARSPRGAARSAGSEAGSRSSMRSTRSSPLRSLALLKRRQERQKKQITGPQTQAKIQRDVVIPEVITIQELANRMAEQGVDVIKYLMKDGEMRKITDVIDADTAELIAEEFGHTVRRVSEADVEEGFIGAADHAEDRRRARPVTIMGHVDHGKIHCSTPFAPPTSSRKRPAASPSISAPTKWRRRPAPRSPLSTRRPRGLHRHARPRRQGHRHRDPGGRRR